MDLLNQSKLQYQKQIRKYKLILKKLKQLINSLKISELLKTFQLENDLGSIELIILKIQQLQNKAKIDFTIYQQIHLEERKCQRNLLK